MYGPSESDIKFMVTFFVIGLIASAIAVIGGVGFAIWFAINHIQII